MKLKSYLDYRLIDLIFIIAGIAGAFFLPEHFILAGFAFVFLIVLLSSNYFFQRFTEKTKIVLEKIGDVRTVHLMSGDKELDVPIDQIRDGDTLIIKEGERIPLDGEVSVGGAYINESFLAKEAERVFKQPSDFVYAGTLNNNASFAMTVRKGKDKGLLSQSMRSAESAKKFKSRFRALSDIAVICAAIIFVILMSYVYWKYSTEGLAKITAFLFAFGAGKLASFGKISVMSVFYSLISEGAVINKEYILKSIGRARSFVLHKTEKLLLSKKSIFSIISFWGADENKALSLAASAHKYSHDILAKIILEEAAKRSIKYSVPLKFEVVKGRGTKAHLPDGSVVLAGSEEFMRMSDLHIQESISQQIQAGREQSRAQEQLLLIAHENKVMGAIFFKDALQLTSKIAFEDLRKAGVEKVILVSEKEESDSRKIADYLGVDKYLTNQSLKQQQELMANMQKGGDWPVFVGDGVSDKEMLNAKWIGIAVGAMENNLPADAADIVLLKNKLSLIPIIFKQAKRLNNILLVNFLLGLAYHVAVAALIIFGVLGAFEALAANFVFSTILILNTSRIVSA